MIRQPETYALKWNAFLHPFGGQLWLVVIVCIITLTASVTFHSVLRGDIGKGRNLDFTSAAFITYGIFCMQGKL